MSKVANIYDDILARLAAKLPSHSKLTHAYALPECISPHLALGYGVKIGPVENTRRLVNCRVSIRRQFNVVITRRFRQTDIDADAKTSVEKELFEDQLLVLLELERNPTLNGDSANVTFTSDGGIEFVNTRDEEFMVLDTTYAVEYFEDI